MRRIFAWGVACAILTSGALAQEASLARPCVPQPVVTPIIVKVDGKLRTVVQTRGFCNPWEAMTSGLAKAFEQERIRLRAEHQNAARLHEAPLSVPSVGR